MEEFIKFLEKWQTLIGTAMGLFFAVVLSAIGICIRSIIREGEERKEFLLRIEISMARSLNDIFTVREQLKWFSQRVKNLATESRAITDNTTFFLNRINFPISREIFQDIGIPNFKVKSYYLHNKIIWVDAGIKEINETILNLEKNFEDMIRQNEILVAVMRNNPNPPMQRETYAKNLENFSIAIDEYVSKSIQQGIEIMAQVKIYNEKIRKRFGFWFLWKQEGSNFKYFRNKAEQEEFSRNLDSLERIDNVIKKEVESTIEKAEKRFSELTQK